jgi:hypothetical protein
LAALVCVTENKIRAHYIGTVYYLDICPLHQQIEQLTSKPKNVQESFKNAL